MAAPTLLSEFIDTMFEILSLPTGYWNAFPYNLGYWHGTEFTFDCVNLLKAVINGWENNQTVGYYQSDLSRTGDVNEWDFINECAGTSSYFPNMTACAGLYMDGHIGCYMGGEFTRDGKTYNTIECTTGFGQGGVIATYVDGNGTRWKDKDMTESGGNWLLYGYLTPWLTYDTQFVDPGSATDPINPGGGNTTPPWWQSPVLTKRKKLPIYMMLKRRRL